MKLRARQTFNKYRIERVLGQGGFATVYQAFDTVEGIRVAIKVPGPDVLKEHSASLFREVRLAARLEHPNVVSLRFAGYLDGRFVMVSPLGKGTLEDRLQRRLAPRTALTFAGQLLEALAYAHQQRVMHCDVKPDNIVLFQDDQLKLTDFGIAKVASRTVRASGSGTIGYVAPEQAMGRPSFRSDVFAAGLVIYRMFAGRLPEWPFTWPFPGHEALRRRAHTDFIALLRRALELTARKRFPDASAMLRAFRALEKRALRQAPPGRRPARRDSTNHWREARLRSFRRTHGKILEAHHHCSKCQGPVSEPMIACPWCGTPRKRHGDGTRFPQQCPRCSRGVKLDWSSCAWCYGYGFETAEKKYSDRRYTGRCANRNCSRKQLMPFMRYCPWCRTKVRKRWTIPGGGTRCGSCDWDVLTEYWSHCPWCAVQLPRPPGP